MKKILSVACIAMVLMILPASSAMAYHNVDFSLYVQCVNENTLTYFNGSASYKMPDNDDEKLYVWHEVIGGSNAYTNMFHAVKHVGAARILVGQKFATTFMNVPIQSNAIEAGYDYTIAARGNTRHSQEMGVMNVTLEGTFENRY